MRYRFYNAKILTMEDRDILDGEIWINGTDIEYVGPAAGSAAFDEEIDCEGNLLMPTFKNAHTHTAMTFSRSLADNLPLDVWLHTKIFPMEARLTFDHIYWFTKLGILEYLRNGISCAFDMYLDRDATNKASDESGFRFSYVSGANDFGGVDNLEEEYLKHKDYSDLVTMKLGFHAEYTTSRKNLEKIAYLADKYKAPVFAHNSETRKEVDECIGRYNMTPTQIMDELGIFNYGGGGFHCVHMDDRDYEIFKKRDLLAVFNPCSNLKLSSGIADVKRFIDEGINVSVGTDGAGSNNSLNMFRDLYLACVLPNVREEGNANIDPYVLLKGLTSVGSDYMGFSDCKYIKAGQKADIMMIDMSNPSMQPVNNIIDNLVYSGSPDIVKMTMINGKILYRDGEYLTLDKKEINDTCNKIIREIKL
ncbi:MAG: amidohydrolase family protein [Clostridiales bacterium]|nr:amidohydrolase family protein [Clostridiales bacterium]